MSLHKLAAETLLAEGRYLLSKFMNKKTENSDVQKGETYFIYE
jgi:hypothetical protein